MMLLFRSLSRRPIGFSIFAPCPADHLSARGTGATRESLRARTPARDTLDVPSVSSCLSSVVRIFRRRFFIREINAFV